ncbi:MAG: MATE family efflux transporter [Ruminococcaceae bacterium]|nr:MATE family efflux transporter [Oscillospiraceae bacterium]
MHSIKTLHLPHFHRNRRHDVDMTEGSIVPHLIKFAIPLLLGNIFQQLYNMVDTWVVGNYVSNEAFSAVGSVGPIINTLIGFFTGLSSGAGAVISQFYGAKKEDKVREAVHTAVVMTAILGVAFTGIGLFMTPYMLRLMKTPADVFEQSQIYLTIYFAGIFGLMVYNIGAGILRAVGDSRRPFYFLVITAILNTVLDLVFVLVFEMGVEGVALATIIAQGVSAVLVMITLMRSTNCVRISLKHLKMRMEMLKKIVGVGFPAALQMSITSFSNVFVQSYINYFGSDFMAGWTAYAKIDQLAILPMQSLAVASTTFVGQNLGCRQDKRARKGVFVACALAVAITALFLIPIMIFAPWLVSFFNGKTEVVAYGTTLLRVISPFYLLCCLNQILAGSLRGAGNSRAAMLILVPSFVIFRQIYLFIMANYICNEFIPIAMAYPAGWILASTLLVIYYLKVGLRGRQTIVEE